MAGTGLPNANVLYYDLTDDAWLCVRPSGTEPKVKFYYGVKGTSLEDADEMCIRDRNDTFSRYEPWENPNYYAGMMRFTCGGRNFRLERHFDRYHKSAELICEDDGEELSVENGDLEMLLGGIGEASFENMAAIGRLSAKPGQDLAACLLYTS